MTRAFQVAVIATGCHVWLGAAQSKGYGSVTDRQGGTMLAHRAAWEQANGPIPEGMTVDHICRNKRCVNVEHMELVTAAENTARAARSRRYCPRGHEYTAENTVTNGRGWRFCRTCHNEARRVGVRPSAHTAAPVDVVDS